MTKSKLIEIHEQLLKSMERAETQKKDLDILICLRILFMLIEERIKND